MYQEPDFKTYEYMIGGKLVVGRAVIEDSYWTLMNSDAEARKQVKSKLIHQMAEFILENNLVEFTQAQNPMDFSTTVMVRAYLAPNDQVKILRLANKVV
jgi:hypothetical protein